MTSLFLLYYNFILLFNNFIEYSDLVVIIREYFRRFCLPSLFFHPLSQFLSQFISLLYDTHDGTVELILL
jgi:hypothetical protein